MRFRVIADHVRSGLMLIGDGVTPGNEARGYVLRRLLRRAVRSMRLLGYDDPALPELLPVSLERMKASYPELERDFARISQVAYAEEEAFRQTLDKGTTIFDLEAGRAKSANTGLSGEAAFTLHDTYGFPIDLTLEMASEQGLSVDEDGFRALMGEQRARAKADARSKKGHHADTSVYRAALDANGPTDWQAYTTLTTESRVLGLLAEGAAVPALTAGTIGEVVLDRTPFYAESGGQNADAGTISWDGGSAEVLDVQRPVRGLVVHQVRVLDGELTLDATVEAQVDPEWRLGARQAHSGTHVVHAALREVLGPTALQSGSYNRPGLPAARLRLDRRPVAGAVPRRGGGLQPRLARGPPGVRRGHAPRPRQGDRRAGAVRRDLRRGRPGRRDRRPVVARALRRHPRRALVADRHRRPHLRQLGGCGQPSHRGRRRAGRLPLPRPRA